MIQGTIKIGDAVIFNTVFTEYGMSLESALKNLETYVVREWLNKEHECHLNAKFCAAPEEKTINLAPFGKYTYDALRG